MWAIYSLNFFGKIYNTDLRLDTRIPSNRLVYHRNVRSASRKSSLSLDVSLIVVAQRQVMWSVTCEVMMDPLLVPCKPLRVLSSLLYTARRLPMINLLRFVLRYRTNAIGALRILSFVGVEARLATEKCEYAMACVKYKCSHCSCHGGWRSCKSVWILDEDQTNKSLFTRTSTRLLYCSRPIRFY